MAKIFLLGASGFIGSHILDKLVSDRHEVTCLVRKASSVKLKEIYPEGVKFLLGEYTESNSWINKLEGHDILINAVGIIRETRYSNFLNIHQDTPIKVFRKCEELGVKKVIQLSALGADEHSESSYHKTKKAADDFLKELNLNSLILRPSFVYGPGDTSMNMFSGMSSFPVQLIPSHGNFKLSPLYIDDLICVIFKFINENSVKSECLNLGGQTTLTLKSLFSVLANLQGNKSFIQFSVPEFLISISARITKFTGFGPITTDEWLMLKRENYCTTENFRNYVGREPLPLSKGLARAQMHFNSYNLEILKLLLPFLRFSVAFIWIYTGLISAFLVPEEYSLKLLGEIGLTGSLAKISLYFSSFLEVILGFFILKSFFVNFITALQIGMIIFFSIALSFSPENFWFHPFGPLSKNIPLLGAIFVLWALERIFNKRLK